MFALSLLIKQLLRNVFWGVYAQSSISKQWSSTLPFPRQINLKGSLLWSQAFKGPNNRFWRSRGPEPTHPSYPTTIDSANTYLINIWLENTLLILKTPFWDFNWVPNRKKQQLPQAGRREWNTAGAESAHCKQTDESEWREEKFTVCQWRSGLIEFYDVDTSTCE